MEKKFIEKIWVDADACPKSIKEIIFKVSLKLEIYTILVANSYIKIPISDYISFIQVQKGLNVADNYIVDNASLNDLVITADIPLASDLVNKEVLTINPRGNIYTKANISEILSIRNFMTDLRSANVKTSGPANFADKDKQNFAASLDKILVLNIKHYIKKT